MDRPQRSASRSASRFSHIRLANAPLQRLSAWAMGILGKIFTWWDGATIGTSLFTARKGSKVGEDHQGNVYYQGGVDPNA